MKKPLRHIFDYLVLCFIFSISLVLYLFQWQSQVPNARYLGDLIFYILWGYLHHRKG